MPEPPAWERFISARANASKCERGGAAPSTAFCISGAARSFSSPLVLAALRANWVQPLAGDPPSGGGTAGARVGRHGSRLFLHLKVSDSGKFTLNAGTRFHRHTTSIESLLHTLSNTGWLAGMTADLVIVNGSGAAPQGARGSRKAARGGTRGVVQSDGTLWREYRSRECDGPGGGNATAPCCPRAQHGHYLDIGDNEE